MLYFDIYYTFITSFIANGPRGGTIKFPNFPILNT